MFHKDTLCSCSGNCSCLPSLCLCSECYSSRLKMKYSLILEDQSIANHCQDDTSRVNQRFLKQNYLLDKLKKRSPSKKQWHNEQQKSSSNLENNLNSYPKKNSESHKKISSWSEKILKMIEKQGFPEHLYPINVIPDIAIGEISNIPPRSTLTESIERKVNIHLTKEFSKLDCVDRKRLQRGSNSSKHYFGSLAKRKRIQYAKEERPEFQRNTSFAVEHFELKKDASLESESIRPIPNWKRFLDDMKVPDSLQTSLNIMEETQMESTGTSFAVSSSHSERRKRDMNYASQIVDKDDSSGYESEYQSPEVELSLFHETTSLKARHHTSQKTNSSKSFSMVGDANEERVPSMGNLFSRLDSFDENACFNFADRKFGSHQLNPFFSYFNSSSEPLNKLNAMHDMLQDLNNKNSLKEPFSPYSSGPHLANDVNRPRVSPKSKFNKDTKLNKKSRSPCKVPDYSKPGCSKDSNYMDSYSVDYSEPIGRIQKHSVPNPNFGSKRHLPTDTYRHDRKRK